MCERLTAVLWILWVSPHSYLSKGPWFSLRALVVLRDVDWYEGADPPPCRAKITERGRQQLEEQLKRALQSEKTEEWIELRSLAARLVGCDGESVRYSEQQLSYHYYRQGKDALAKLLK